MPKKKLPANLPLIKDAIAVAKKYPVFPTNKKMPAWSNQELGVGRGEGGYKIATRDKKKVTELFQHPRAKEIGVPTGERSGLLCIDVDLQKGKHVEQWHRDNFEYLNSTLCHKTRSGGLHYFFHHVPGVRWPAQLADGVDVKSGNGYVCFPPTEGYSVFVDHELRDIDLDWIEGMGIMRERGGTGNLSMSSAYNTASDEELMEKVFDASELYPSIRTLSMRLASRRVSYSDGITILQGLMNDSVASSPTHKRHEVWKDRYSKIEILMETAIEKEAPPKADTLFSEALLAEGPSFLDTQRMIAASSRPIGPQRETKIEDIEQLVEELEDEEEFDVFTTDQLNQTSLPEIQWLIEGMLPKGGISSLGGTSNVGKTRWLAALAACLSTGETEKMGLPKAEASSVVWICNEEHSDDIRRRIKAAGLQYDLGASRGRIAVRPKTEGTFRLVACNEVGNQELDAASIARLVKQIKRLEAKAVFLDPYVTLSDGGVDENSSATASMLTKAFLQITAMTGATLIHAHHTPKNRQLDVDFYRGDASGWRGSGAIYSALDCGFTLANWMPKNSESRKAWKKNFIDDDLGRWVVLDTGKIREGKPMDSIIYELVGEELPEGFEIGVCRLASEVEAENALVQSSADAIRASELGDDLISALGFGRHSSMTKVANAMEGHPLMPDATQSRGKAKLAEMYKETVSCSEGYVTMLDETPKKNPRAGNRAPRQKWVLLLEAKEK